MAQISSEADRMFISIIAFFAIDLCHNFFLDKLINSCRIQVILDVEDYDYFPRNMDLYFYLLIGQRKHLEFGMKNLEQIIEYFLVLSGTFFY